MNSHEYQSSLSLVFNIFFSDEFSHAHYFESAGPAVSTRVLKNWRYVLEDDVDIQERQPKLLGYHGTASWCSPPSFDRNLQMTSAGVKLRMWKILRSVCKDWKRCADPLINDTLIEKLDEPYRGDLGVILHNISDEQLHHAVERKDYLFDIVENDRGSALQAWIDDDRCQIQPIHFLKARGKRNLECMRILRENVSRGNKYSLQLIYDRITSIIKMTKDQ